jgi:hypothetical protein
MVSVRILGYDFQPNICEGSEKSSEEGFTDLPPSDQVKILREEMWEWMTGRSGYFPMQFNNSEGPTPKAHEFAQHRILTKAVMIETLLKISE